MVKTKSQKVLVAISYACRSYRGKTGPVLNRVKYLLMFNMSDLSIEL